MNRPDPPFASPDEAFAVLTTAEQTRLLIRLARELTLVARDYYVPGTLELSDPAAVRLVNEVQHRVTAHAEACLDGGGGDAPVGYGFVTDCWEHDGLREKVWGAFARAYDSVRPLTAAAAG
ncbi:MAG: hypothetical protein K2X82_02870 [Gemmataceae bacterium]|nr:hypothetical protein [Gemmataceae bacterium]